MNPFQELWSSRYRSGRVRVGEMVMLERTVGIVLFLHTRASETYEQHTWEGCSSGDTSTK